MHGPMNIKFIQLGVGVLCITPFKLEFRENRLSDSCKLFKVANECFNKFGVNFNVQNLHIISLRSCGLPTNRYGQAITYMRM